VGLLAHGQAGQARMKQPIRLKPRTILARTFAPGAQALKLLPATEQILFAYGTLEDEKKKRLRPALVPGQLRINAAGDACARFDMPGLVHGLLLRVTGDDLRRYNQRETGYQRIKVRCTDGTVAWAYNYSKPDWVKLKWVPSGIWKKGKR
jgi:gamma-glutamylcyclotransferase (GGCT)/AIG2-like uncharacterized protein YtfP